MRRHMSKVISVVLTMSLALSMCACSAKSSADTENTTAEAETEIETETEEETEEETVGASGNDPSGNDVSDNDVPGNDVEEETEEESEDSSESKTKSASEEEEEESPESESTNSKTSEKDSTKSETTTSETTTEAVTVQSVSAVVSGTHYVGETLTGADFTVTVTFVNGETLTNPAGWSAQPLTLSSTSNLITVAYEGASVTITVEASVMETTTAATVASNTTSTTGTKAETTQAATTQATTAATTAATTQAETTTAAETTASTVIDYTKNGYLTWEPGTVSYEASIALFNAQNDVRISEGHEPYVWNDEMYEAAKLCAKACEDAGGMSHTATGPYRWYTFVYDSEGNSWDNVYDENLQALGYGSMYVDMLDMWAADRLKAICNSPGHYKQISGEDVKLTAVAAYRTSDGNMIYISYLFRGSYESLWIGP